MIYFRWSLFSKYIYSHSTDWQLSGTPPQNERRNVGSFEKWIWILSCRYLSASFSLQYCRPLSNFDSICHRRNSYTFSITHSTIPLGKCDHLLFFQPKVNHPSATRVCFSLWTLCLLFGQFGVRSDFENIHVKCQSGAKVERFSEGHLDLEYFLRMNHSAFRNACANFDNFPCSSLRQFWSIFLFYQKTNLLSRMCQTSL